MKKHLLLIGAPGAGKGSVSKELKGYTQLSTGDMLRAEAKKDTEFGHKIDNLISNGKFASDEDMFKVLQANLPEDQVLIFDGYPRNKTQIEYFEKLFFSAQNDVAVIYFNADLDIVRDRLVNRLTCESCSEIHNLKSNPPNTEGNCNKCGGSLAKRSDDTVDKAETRLDIFIKNTLPIVDHFNKYPNFLEVDANQELSKTVEIVKKWLENIN